MVGYVSIGSHAFGGFLDFGGLDLTEELKLLESVFLDEEVGHCVLAGADSCIMLNHTLIIKRERSIKRRWITSTEPNQHLECLLGIGF